MQQLQLLLLIDLVQKAPTRIYWTTIQVVGAVSKRSFYMAVVVRFLLLLYGSCWIFYRFPIHWLGDLFSHLNGEGETEDEEKRGNSNFKI